MFAAALVIEPLTSDLAAELGHGIPAHCFDEQGFIRDEFTQVQVRPREAEQALTLRAALDVAAHCVIRHVRVPLITVTKKGADDGPATLRLTLSLLVDAADRIAQEFFCLELGASYFVGFEPEQQNLFSSDDLAEDNKARAGLLPPDDAEAGDVLDEQAAADVATPRTPKPKRGAKPRLVKGGPTPAPGSDSVQ